MWFIQIALLCHKYVVYTNFQSVDTLTNRGVLVRYSPKDFGIAFGPIIMFIYHVCRR